ncbi:hypothetical protein CPB84DRAFT_1851943 [Gymnopilus junonius]|uniref:Uncharacterized protein n=1 Tax=Gymnopilus junonius TaxID=109634 RepID=A0A9P5TH17_GYMJU|nr:hypothetical protein CPB84DRAFT_1851943 [Gymnopilus junonius]
MLNLIFIPLPCLGSYCILFASRTATRHVFVNKGDQKGLLRTPISQILTGDDNLTTSIFRSANSPKSVLIKVLIGGAVKELDAEATFFLLMAQLAGWAIWKTLLGLNEVFGENHPGQFQPFLSSAEAYFSNAQSSSNHRSVLQFVEWKIYVAKAIESLNTQKDTRQSPAYVKEDGDVLFRFWTW